MLRYDNKIKVFLRVVICLSISLYCYSPATILAEGVYLDFDDFPVTPSTPGATPGNASGWEYSSSVTNNYGYTESSASGWKSSSKRADGWNWFFNLKREGACSSHLGGGDTYGFLDIVAGGHSGNALRYFVTGGLEFTDTSPCTGRSLGKQLYNKESYAGTSDHYTGGPIGHMYLYFKKIDQIGISQDYSPFLEIGNSNRMYFYIYLPDDTHNGNGGYAGAVEQTLQIGTFQNDAPGHLGHHYQNVFTQGGGWTKVQIDETSNGDNSGNSNTRYIPGFLTTLYQFYLTTLPYSGESTPPYEILTDNIGFEEDTYTPQNNETISNIAVMYKDTDQTWEISWGDKYYIADSFSTWEVRYSLNGPITNENWNSATPVEILADSRFSIQARTDGKFQKWWPDSKGVWAPFKLTSEDTNSLSTGQTVYFAVKDISQVGGNTNVPTDGINGYWGTRRGGRPYDTNSNFDFATDKNALLHIKRISYLLPSISGGNQNVLIINSAQVY